jgi:hypothetical protein
MYFYFFYTPKVFHNLFIYNTTRRLTAMGMGWVKKSIGQG